VPDGIHGNNGNNWNQGFLQLVRLILIIGGAIWFFVSIDNRNTERYNELKSEVRANTSLITYLSRDTSQRFILVDRRLKRIYFANKWDYESVENGLP